MLLNGYAVYYRIPQAADLKYRHFSGTIERYASIESFLELFETGTNIKFDLYGHKIIVKEIKE